MVRKPVGLGRHLQARRTVSYFAYHPPAGTAADLASLIERGMRRLGIAPGPVAKPIAPSGSMPEKRPARSISPEIDAEIRRLRAKNLNQADIAARLGISQSAVSKRLRRSRSNPNPAMPV